MAKQTRSIQQVDIKKLPKGITQERIENLKKTHKKRLFLIQQETFDGETKHVIVRDFDDDTYMAAMSLAEGENIDSAAKMSDLLFNQLVVFGKEDFEDDIRYRMSIGSQIAQLMSAPKASLKKL